MIGNSLKELIFIRTCIIGLRAIAPLSITYCLARPFFTSASPNSLEIYFLLESCFYCLVFLPLKSSSQYRAVHPPLRSVAKRRALVEKCLATVPRPEIYLGKWFKDAPLETIARVNVKEFLAWAFFNAYLPQIEDATELDEYVDRSQEVFQLAYPDRRREADSIKLTLDEVKMRHRPLIWYGIMSLLDLLAHFWLAFSGFQFHRSSLHLIPRVFPLRPQSLFYRRRSPASTLSYWYRPHRSTTRSPVLLLHGIGIGLLTYIPFLNDLNKSTNAMLDDDDEIGIIAIELLPISFRITRSSLAQDDMCAQILTILKHHNFQNFVVVSHSYGSVLSTHLLHDPAIAPMIKSVVLIDPVSILLHLPEVAYNFTYRRPRLANEWQLWYFASTDMGVAHTLGRGFFWSENILWKEDLGARETSVFLAGRDLIVNVAEVRNYLMQGGEEEHAGKEVVRNGKVTTFWAGELDHAQIFNSKARRRTLIDDIKRHCGSGVVE